MVAMLNYFTTAILNALLYGRHSSLEFEGLTRTQEPQDRILRALYDGPNGLKWKEFGDRDNNVVYHESFVRKDEEPKDFEFIIPEMQNKLCF